MMKTLRSLPASLKQYLIITGNYWAFTVTDGALRMLVLLHFHSLGFSPVKLAMLFLFYEFFGVVTNLLGGWLGARIGLNHTMHLGLALQIAALSMLLLPVVNLSVLWVMFAQALSGIAKDLNKMSAKSAIKVLLPKNTDNQQRRLYHWVAVLTGSKNALKGIGFFVGAGLLEYIGFTNTVASMIGGLTLVFMASLFLLKKDLGKAKNKPKFKDVFAKDPKINMLAAARLFLFASRDIWFVVAVPVYLSSHFFWNFWQIGAFMALWIIGYGLIQSLAPKLTVLKGQIPDGSSAFLWSSLLAIVILTMAMLFSLGWHSNTVLIIGLCLFGMVFAVNSSLHSYLIVSYAKADGVSLDVGFYYMANAMGRLFGTLLSGIIYQWWGIQACLWGSAVILVITALISIALPRRG